jgi:WD repeat-containing protein 19
MSAEYAQQLEFKGENEAALAMYEQALAGFSSDNNNTNSSNSSSKRRSSSISDYAAESKFEPATTVNYNTISSNSSSDSSTSKQQKSCTAGIARCALRLGDLHRGLTLARSADDQALYRDAAEILEQMRQPGEAAAMWERGAQYERALALHVAGKNMSAAAAVVGRVTLPKLLGVYARACEAQGNWAAAAEAHERARDMDAVARLCLEQLNQVRTKYHYCYCMYYKDGVACVKQ